jgi:hypothetical protein
VDDKVSIPVRRARPTTSTAPDHDIVCSRRNISVLRVHATAARCGSEPLDLKTASGVSLTC